MSTQQKFDALIKRLAHKISISATPVQGFIVGLSGTDSIITYALLAETALRMKAKFAVRGIHYTDTMSGTSLFLREGTPDLLDAIIKRVGNY